ncbi:hypothetical protein LIER_30547 [Lithospermum erythrorhizon]|uniref:Smr domain-containing protein n=1 Tax=Lithospermum erythrorhizon TaxID=34254 RepID=A0AAV3RN16_LITER
MTLPLLHTVSFISLPLKPTLFTKPLLKPHPIFSLQEQTQTQSQSQPKSKSYIWVNPNSTNASKLHKKSYDFRYASLTKVAQNLDSCDPFFDDIDKVLSILVNDSDFRLVEQDAVVVLNNMSNPENAVFVLQWFQERVRVSKGVILYNVTLKVFRKGRDFERAERLFREMLEMGMQPDNVTFSTMISCARHCGFAEKAVEWFEKMNGYGIEPDDVSYCVMIDAYGKAGNVGKAMSLYDRAREKKWRIDAVTFATLVKINGVSGNFDGCLNVYEEMKALRVKPNHLVYNNLLDAMGRAKRPWQAKNIYKEMINNGLRPNWATYASLLRAFGRARYGEDALLVYRETKEKGLELNIGLYNTLLSMCADLGLLDEAMEIFEDMKGVENCKPDSWTYSSLITLYSCCGKVSEAETMFNELMESGFEANIFVFTSLIQAYGKANRTNDIVNTFDQLIEMGITPDERFTCCLLNVINQIPKEELYKVTKCIEKANPKLGSVVQLIVHGDKTDGKTFREEAAELFQQIGADVRKAYCNCLIDLCVNLDQLERACELFDLGMRIEIYHEVHAKTPTQWYLNVKSLSLGAALTALHIWINDLTKVIEDGEELPSVLGISTGHGKHKYSEKGLAGAFESHLKELNSPFHEASEQAGWFFTTKVAATSWLESRRSSQAIAG